MDTLNNIIMYYNCSSPKSTYHVMLGKILQNLDKIQNATIYDISELCSVAPATVGRLARELGYSNFADMKSSISSVIRNLEYSQRILSLHLSDTPKNFISNYISGMHGILNEFEESANIHKYLKIVREIHRAKKVRLYNMTMDFADYCLQINLINDSKDVLMICGYSDQLSDADSLDKDSFVVVHFWAGSHNMDMRSIFKKIKDSGAQCLIITGTDNSIPIGHDSDFALWGARADGNIMLGGSMNTYHMEVITAFYRLIYIDKIWPEPEM